MIQLLNLKLGSGAIVLPNDVREVHLQFAPKINNGHGGARKFWRNALPRIKYHNPSIPMTVTRIKDQETPATLTLSFGRTTTSSMARDRTLLLTTTTQAASVEGQPGIDRKEVIDLTNLHDSEILARLTKLTNAIIVLPTAEEEEQLQKLEVEKAKSRQDALVNTEYLEQKRRANVFLDQVKGEVFTS